MHSPGCVRKRIEAVISGSSVPEDAPHSKNTLQWLLKLKPDADEALQIAALGHDIERAVNDRKVRREDYGDYDGFKAAHARNSAKILMEIMTDCAMKGHVAEDVCRLVRLHEIGGDSRSDILKDADAISFFDVNLPLYFERNGWDETKQRAVWGCQRLSGRMKKVVQGLSYEEEQLNRLLKSAIKESF